MTEKIVVTTADELRIMIEDVVSQKIEQLEAKLLAVSGSVKKKSNKLLRRDELRKLLKCSYPKIRSLMNKGLPYIRIDRILYYDEDEVLNFINTMKS